MAEMIKKCSGRLNSIWSRSDLEHETATIKVPELQGFSKQQ